MEWESLLGMAGISQGRRPCDPPWSVMYAVSGSGDVIPAQSHTRQHHKCLGSSGMVAPGICPHSSKHPICVPRDRDRTAPMGWDRPNLPVPGGCAGTGHLPVT